MDPNAPLNPQPNTLLLWIYLPPADDNHSTPLSSRIPRKRKRTKQCAISILHPSKTYNYHFRPTMFVSLQFWAIWRPFLFRVFLLSFLYYYYYCYLTQGPYWVGPTDTNKVVIRPHRCYVRISYMIVV